MNPAVDFIHQHRSFILSTHLNPDGDAIGATLALLHLLAGMGKTATAFLQDPVPDNCAFLPGAEAILRPPAPIPAAAAAIALDCGELSRTGPVFAAAAQGLPLLNLDHHRTNLLFGAANWVDPEASSTGEMIGLLAPALNATVSPETALCIYTAILTDTGSFQFSNTTPRALEVAAQMIARGARPELAAQRYYHARPASHLLLLGHGLSTLTFNSDCTRGDAVITSAMFKSAGADAAATEGIINLIADVDPVRVAVLVRETQPGQWKVSLRSKGELDVSGLAARFGGGGHRNAAGCSLSGPLATVLATVRAAVDELLGSGR